MADRETRKALPGRKPGTPWDPEEWAEFKKQAIEEGAILQYEGKPFENVVWVVEHHIHREDKPAVIYMDGTEAWFELGDCHRLDGPAIIFPNGKEEWWKEGVQFTDGTFSRVYVL